jgi:hypothetical protein
VEQAKQVVSADVNPRFLIFAGIILITQIGFKDDEEHESREEA